MHDGGNTVDAPERGRWFRAVVGGGFLAAGALGMALAGCGAAAGVFALTAGRAQGEWTVFVVVLGLIAIAACVVFALVALAIGRTVAAPCALPTRRLATAVWTVAVGVAWTALLRPGITQLDGAEAWAWMAPGIVTCVVGVTVGARTTRPPAASPSPA